eukprot:c17494_g1_i1 orf=165-2480(+)
MEVEVQEYKLCCQLRGHEEDVRGICVCGENGIATGSRDKTVRYWCIREGSNNGYSLDKTMVGHTSFVGPVAWIPPNKDLPKGGLVSGGMDTRVIIWDIGKSQPVQTLQGHELQVTSVVIDEQADILSASVDSTVKRWHKGQIVEVLRGHKGPVQAVLTLPSGDVVTGSSDSTLKIWRGMNCIQTISGHSDTVRGLALMANVGFLSASHDGSVRLWAFTGEPLLEMVGHTAIVYCVAADPSGDIVSGSEDCFVKVWRNGICCQTIQHPGCVWDVKFLPNGDFVTACSDGVARIWTRDCERFSSPEQIEAYQAEIAARKSQMKTVGGVHVNDLPGIEALSQPGKKDGQSKIIREGDSGVAYSWNEKEYKWEKIGEVVDGPDLSQSRHGLTGVHYDYVFDVDIGDGQPIRKLPYNRGDNPYLVADRWLLSEDLPLSYREQIVDFILRNTGQMQPALDSSYVDPYTGAHAYVPSQQQSREVASSISNCHGDSSGVRSYSFQHIPKRDILLFDSAQYEGILRKVAMFNSMLAADEVKMDLALGEVDLSKLEAVVSVLKDTSQYHIHKLTDDDFVLLAKLALSWPPPMLFPVLDLLRMSLLYPQAADRFSEDVENGKDVIMEALQRATALPAIDANLLTGVRVAVNCFRHGILRNWTIRNRSQILDLFSECSRSSNKNVRQAYVTLLLNYSVILTATKDEDGLIQVLSAALEMAGADEQDVVTRFRALLAIGSLMMNGTIKNVAIDLDIKSIINAAIASQQAQLLEVSEDIEHLLCM